MNKEKKIKHPKEERFKELKEQRESLLNKNKLFSESGVELMQIKDDLPVEIFIEDSLDREVLKLYSYEECGSLIRNGVELKKIKLISKK